MKRVFWVMVVMMNLLIIRKMSLKMLKLITIEDDDENSEEDAINENEFLAGRK